MPEHDDEPGAEPRRCELDAPDLRRRDDVAGDADDEEIAEPLIEDDLSGHPGVGTAEDDRERFLPARQLAPTRLARQFVAANIRDESAIALAQPRESF